MSPRKARSLYWIITIPSAALAFLYTSSPGFPLVLGTLGLLGIVAAFCLLLRFWRCPSCGHLLPIRSMLSIEHCPHCGEQLPEAK